MHSLRAFFSDVDRVPFLAFWVSVMKPIKGGLSIPSLLISIFGLNPVVCIAIIAVQYPGISIKCPFNFLLKYPVSLR